MTTLFSFLIMLLAIMFWMFRVVVALTDTLSIEFIIQPINLELEIILLFVTLVGIVFIIKRSLIGTLIYLISYCAYFGKDIYDCATKMIEGQAVSVDYFSILISAIGVLIAFLAFFDVALNNSKKGSTKDKKTDWFYTNKQYDRKFDDRADQNQYKIR